MVTVIAIGGVWSPTAMAVGSQKAADVVNERAAAELDRVSGAGTSDKLGGTVQETVGKAKRGAANLTDGFDNSLGDKLDSAANKLDGATDEVAGKVKRDVGKAKGAAANAADDVEETSKGFVESVKDFSTNVLLASVLTASDSLTGFPGLFLTLVYLDFPRRKISHEKLSRLYF